MTEIVFKLKNDTPAGEIGAALKEICSISALFNVKAVFPDEAAAGRGYLYTAQVQPDVETTQVLAAVKQAQYVERAYVPPVRRAMS